MTKFPILNLYRTLFNIGAILVLIAGAVTIASNVSETGFEFRSVASAFFPFLALSVGLAFLAEVIKLALTIEKHLEKIAQGRG